MGGFDSVVSSNGFTFGMSGLTSGLQIGSGIANAKYSASAADAAAKSAEDQSKINALLIRSQYESDYRELNSQQERQTAEKRVAALKRGRTGDSADASMQAYAAKDQRNKERLYYDAAMKTGTASIQAMEQIREARAKAAHYRWLAASTAVSGAIDVGTTLLGQYVKTLGSGQNPAEGASSLFNGSFNGYSLEGANQSLMTGYQKLAAAQ